MKKTLGTEENKSNKESLVSFYQSRTVLNIKRKTTNSSVHFGQRTKHN